MDNEVREGGMDGRGGSVGKLLTERFDLGRAEEEV